MSGPVLLARAAAAGLALRLEAGRVRWRAAREPPPDLLAELHADREAVAAALAADEAAQGWRDAYEERAAIMEFDGGMARHEAEVAARAEMAERGAPPAAIPDPESGGPASGGASDT